MAARAEEPFSLEVLDLRHFQARDLVPLLEEEGQIWRQKLRWDFHASSDVVRRYVDMRALNGYVLRQGRLPIGYSYYVHEEHKILIGDLFVSEPFRTRESQHLLLRHVVEAAQNTPGVRRIEAQLMMLDSLTVQELYPPGELSVFERDFMLAERIGLLRRERLPPGPGADIAFQPWAERHIQAAANLIAGAYQDHVDSRINDQYRSVAGANRFLHNIVQYPGCGTFFGPASLTALDRRTGVLCGVSLASLVAPRVGHITQICVSPAQRGRGIGSELLWRSLVAFLERDNDAVSLTVTASNRSAARLYERFGFRTVRRFRAYAWEGFRMAGSQSRR
jgi:ribosomal protein S18 acetylase RimI-like enzyme